MSEAARVSRELQRIARRVDDVITDVTAEKRGWILMVWAGGEVSYVGTDDDRPKVIRAMREMIAKWEANHPAVPAHERH